MGQVDPLDAPEKGRGGPNTPTRDAVVTHIRRAIVLGDLKPGDRLREVQLARALGVSRSTLREAVNPLVEDGLLHQEPYRGLSVATLADDAVRDLARTRVGLDLIALRDIAGDVSGRRLARVRQAWEAFEAGARSTDPFIQHEAHVAFHYGIWAASENTMLLKLWPVTEALTTIALAQEQVVRTDVDESFQLHAQLFDAIAGGNLDRIELQLRLHTLGCADEFLRGRP